MNSWFGNISVNLKLGLGFGLVLVLTSILALTGWTSLGGLIDRSNWMSDITQLNAGLTKLRISRLQYMLTNGDESAAQNVQGTLDEFSAQQQALLKSFKSPDNLKLLREQGTTIAAYQQSLNKMRSAYRDGNAARQVMGQNAETANSLIEAISTQVKQMPLSDQRFEQFQTITQAREAFLLARYEVRGYTADTKAETEQKALNQLNLAIASLKDLNSHFADTQQVALQQLESALLNYRAALQAYKAAYSQAVDARAEMTVQGADIVKISDRLYQVQLDRRDSESAQARSLQLVSTLLALLVGILAAVLITRQITRPLRETLAVVERIASGDLSHTLHVTRRDELGVLQQGIARMGVTLRELITGIRDGVTQIASAAEELSAVTEETSDGVNRQKVETDQVATAMHEMTATVQEVARNAEHASRAAADADSEARAGDKVVAQAIEQIERLASEVARSTEAMSVLQHESDKIGSVMDVIKAVAEQTNLLALNAAIEAARAGEAGRGFAVVADEVRTLATRTRESTEQIQRSIEQLRDGSALALATAQRGESAARQSREDVTQVQAALRRICDEVGQISGMSLQMASAIEEQGQVAQDINGQIAQIVSLAQTSSDQSRRSTQIGDELHQLANSQLDLAQRFLQG